MMDKKFLDVNTTLCSLFERWLWLWTGFEEDPRQAGDVQVLWVHQVGAAGFSPNSQFYVSSSEDLAICVRCRRKMPDDVKILDDPSYKPKPDSTELMGTKKLRLARYTYTQGEHK